MTSLGDGWKWGFVPGVPLLTLPERHREVCRVLGPLKMQVPAQREP